jgi:hypothetical protein
MAFNRAVRWRPVGVAPVSLEALPIEDEHALAQEVFDVMGRELYG